MKLFFLCVSLLFFVGCEKKVEEYNPQYSDTQTVSKKVLIFGVHPLHNPKRLFEIYQPLVNHINNHLEGVKIKLEASRNYAAYNKKLFARHFDFSLPNPYQILTKQYNLYITVIKYLGKWEMIKSLEDLF